MTFTFDGVQTGPGTWAWTRRIIQDRQDCHYSQINPILGALKSDRQLLALAHKECKDMNRKFCQETNRRRRLLEDKRSQWNLQERRRAEKILQQRREQNQDATKRFQRANQRPAQKRRPTIPAFSGKAINLDDALEQIRGSFNPSRPQSFFLSVETIKASGLVPIKPATVSKSSHCPTPSAVESDTDVVQEQNKTEPDQDPSPQHIHQSDIKNSESLLFEDSLVCEDDVCDTNKHQQVFSSFLMNSDKASSVLHNQNHPTLDLAPYAGLTLVGGEASKKSTKHNLNNQVQTVWHLVSEPSWQFTPFEALGHKESQKASHNSLCGDIGEPFVLHARSPSPKLEALLDPCISLNNRTTDDVVKEGNDRRMAQEKHHPSSQQQYLSAYINNLNKISNLQPKADKPMISESLRSASKLKLQSDTAAGPEKELHVTQISDLLDEVRFTKGILKKIESEEKLGHLGFEETVTKRDSVELTKAKLKETEGSIAVRKKVHWLHLEEEAQEQSSNKSAQFNQLSNDSEDQQPRTNTPPGAPRSADSKASHFTKQADVGVQVSFEEQTDEVTLPRSSNRSAGPEVSRRKHAASPVSTTTQKGTLLPPQSAAKLSQIARSKGQSMIPRPPPRTKAVKGRTACNPTAPYGAAQAQYGAPADRRHAAYAPLPSAFIPTFSEGNAKIAPTSLHQDAHSRARERQSDKLQLTPTDEEITQVWQELRRGLTPKEGKTSTKGHKSGRGFRNPCTQPWPPGNRLHLTPQRQLLTDISLEEQKVLLSLERLDHQLQCVQKRGFVPTPSCKM